MSLIKLSVEHGRSLSDAQGRLEALRSELLRTFGSTVKHAELSADRRTLDLAGAGFEARITVDEREVQLRIDVPLIGRLLASPIIAALKNAVQKKFQALE